MCFTSLHTWYIYGKHFMGAEDWQQTSFVCKSATATTSTELQLADCSHFELSTQATCANLSQLAENRQSVCHNHR